MDYPSVDPDLVPLLEGFPPIDLTAETLAGFREAFASLSVMPDPASHPEVRIEEVRIPGPGDAGSLRCLLYTPTAGRLEGALLHIHSGGFVMGSPEMDGARNVALVRAVGCALLSVDYRLAPEHPHPAALEDAHAALVWLAGRDVARGVRRSRIGVLGESAGGGLAASLALLARDRRSVPLTCQALIYPMLTPPDRAVDPPAAETRTGRYIWTRTSNAFGWSAYLPTSSRNAGPDVAGVAADLSALPPTFIAVGDLDLFVHDDLAYAARLLAAGTGVEAHLYPGAIHGFDRALDSRVSGRFHDDLFAFLRRHLTADGGGATG